MSRVCPRCKQPLPSLQRAGVYLPPKKAAIFDIIAQYPGITIDGICARLGDAITGNAVRVHVFQINDLLTETDVRILGDGIGARGNYRIVGFSAMEAAE